MAKQKIIIVRGTTNSFSVAITDENGDNYELESGEVLRFGVKAKPEDPQYIISKEMTEANADGEYEFTIEVSDTSDLPFKTYSYDIGLQSGEDYYNVIPTSDFVVAKNITEWEEA